MLAELGQAEGRFHSQIDLRRSRFEPWSFQTHLPLGRRLPIWRVPVQSLLSTGRDAAFQCCLAGSDRPFRGNRDGVLMDFERWTASGDLLWLGHLQSIHKPAFAYWSPAWCTLLANIFDNRGQEDRKARQPQWRKLLHYSLLMAKYWRGKVEQEVVSSM